MNFQLKNINKNLNIAYDNLKNIIDKIKNLFNDCLIKKITDKKFDIQECNLCKSTEEIRRCLCKKNYCFKCVNKGEETECIKNCYLFNNNLNYITQIYNISKYPLPSNFEIKLHFDSVDWVRTGITFNKEIINDQKDFNCPQFDIYYMLEDMVEFYTLKDAWKNIFSNNNQSLNNGDDVTITFKNGELRYILNGQDLGNFIKIDLSNKKKIYLLIHARNEKTKCKIMYISEIFN